MKKFSLEDSNCSDENRSLADIVALLAARASDRAQSNHSRTDACRRVVRPACRDVLDFWAADGPARTAAWYTFMVVAGSAGDKKVNPADGTHVS